MLRPLRTAIAGLTLLGAAAFAGAQSADPDSAYFWGEVRYADGQEGILLPDTLPFGSGEVMEFEIRYGPASVGRARLETQEYTVYAGRPALKILSRARSTKWVDSIYRVRDQVGSVLDVERLHSLYFSKKLREGNYKADMEAEYLHEQGIARYHDGSEPELVAGSQDILTALFFVRTFPLEEGMILALPIHDGKKNYNMEVMVIGRETIETPLGIFDCLILEPRLESGGIFKSEGRMLIYMSDDDKRLPVMLKARAPVGAFSSVLKSYEPGEPLPGIALATGSN
jgi:hypothetical protein